MRLFIEISGKIDSLMLWKLIKDYKLNLMALDDKTWVYGDANFTVIADAVSKCALFGDVKAEISKGGVDDEQKEAEAGSESSEGL